MVDRRYVVYELVPVQNRIPPVDSSCPFTGAASTATHCAVFAQLIVKGKKCGVKTFIVQLRDVQ